MVIAVSRKKFYCPANQPKMQLPIALARPHGPKPGAVAADGGLFSID
jgi:hypothetical protein